MIEEPVKAAKTGKRKIRAEETRRALLEAAAVVVGQNGYERASISEITRLAGVASGTFYNHFETRQALFDELLPAVGNRLLEYIRSRLDRSAPGVDVERQRIVAYFEFFERNPGFLRILNEAEVFAPEAFRRHIKDFAERYTRALGVHHEQGELRGFSAEELEAIAYILMGARTYLTMLWRDEGPKLRKESGRLLVDTYVKLVSDGLFRPKAR